MKSTLYFAAEPMPDPCRCVPRAWLRVVDFLCPEDAQCGYCGQIASLGIVNRLPKELLTLRRHYVLCSCADSYSTSHVGRHLFLLQDDSSRQALRFKASKRTHARRCYSQGPLAVEC